MKNWRFIWLIEIINLIWDVLLHHNDKLGVFADFIITDFVIMINWLFPSNNKFKSVVLSFVCFLKDLSSVFYHGKTLCEIMDWNPFSKFEEYSWVSQTKYYKLSHHLLTEWNVMMVVLSSVTSASDQIRKHWIDIRGCPWIM